MNDELRIQQHIDHLFSGASTDSRIMEIKNEILLNTVDRYHDLLAEGKNENEAYANAISSIGDIKELLASLGVPSSTPSPVPKQPKRVRAKGRRRIMLEHWEHIIWMLMLTLYFIISFSTQAWYITWIMFLITPAILGILHAVVDLCCAGKSDSLYIPDANSRKTVNALSSAMWLIITAIYFVISFVSGAWFVTWVIFLMASALQSGISLVCMALNKTKK